MSVYTKYLVCYDIENDKTRKKVFTLLKDLGMIPLQFSVFFGELNGGEFSAMKSKLLSLITDPSDKCLWIRCNLDEHDLKKGIGYKNFSYITPDGYETI